MPACACAVNLLRSEGPHVVSGECRRDSEKDTVGERKRAALSYRRGTE